MTNRSDARAGADTHRVIAGRRWRTTDPALDDEFRQLLVDGLMHARREVKAALAADDDAALRRARDAVQDAKVALGERGPKWWEPTTDAEDDLRVASAARVVQAAGSTWPRPCRAPNRRRHELVRVEDRVGWVAMENARIRT